MSRQPAHTPGEMTYGHRGVDAFWFGPDHDTKPVAIIPWDCVDAREEARANAAELRRRWNSHSALIEALGDTLNMLRAAHMQCGVHHDSNKRVIAAREVLAKAKGPGQ